MIFDADHGEADTRIVFHVSKITSNNVIMVKTSDTDILIIKFGNFQKLKPSLEIWLSTHNTKDQNRINCNYFMTWVRNYVSLNLDFMRLQVVIKHPVFTEKVKYDRITFWSKISPKLISSQK